MNIIIIIICKFFLFFVPYPDKGLILTYYADFPVYVILLFKKMVKGIIIYIIPYINILRIDKINNYKPFRWSTNQNENKSIRNTSMQLLNKYIVLFKSHNQIFLCSAYIYNKRIVLKIQYSFGKVGRSPFMYSQKVNITLNYIVYYY